MFGVDSEVTAPYEEKQEILKMSVVEQSSQGGI